ncbi:MAG TPA: hypothetical protein VG847_00360 [Chitinophagaceae bacterium]|nr:hypothetical protein [Chitinophagaceae bacterium]
MKNFILTILAVSAIILFTACAKRNFYPDDNDAGLSRFTSYGYNIATNYINGKPFINPFSALHGNFLPVFNKISTNSSEDTLNISWAIEREDTTTYEPYHYLNLWIPVSKTFSKENLLGYNGTRITDSCSITLERAPVSPDTTTKGSANIYFVKIEEDKSYSPAHLQISGLFDGNIGDSVLITKGRFDFNIAESALNF